MPQCARRYGIVSSCALRCQGAGEARASLDTVPAPRSTIEKIRATRTIALGYRESSVPFSFVGKDGKPAGYSVELCLVTGGSLLALAGANLPSDFRGLRIAVIPGTTTDRVILIGLAATSRDPRRFVLSDRYFSYEPYALMLRRGDPDFRLAVNRVLARLYRSPQIRDLYARWFGALGDPGSLLIAMYAIEGLPE